MDTPVGSELVNVLPGDNERIRILIAILAGVLGLLPPLMGDTRYRRSR